jgi:hypothetical protein
VTVFWWLSGIALGVGLTLAVISVVVTNAAHNAAAELERQRQAKRLTPAPPAPPLGPIRAAEVQTVRMIFDDPED